MLGPKLYEKYIVSMQCEAQHPIYVGMPGMSSIIKTEVQLLIGVDPPTPIGTQYVQTYWR